MVCSEEHIRKTLQNTLEKIVEDTKNKDIIYFDYSST